MTLLSLLVSSTSGCFPICDLLPDEHFLLEHSLPTDDPLQPPNTIGSKATGVPRRSAPGRETGQRCTNRCTNTCCAAPIARPANLRAIRVPGRSQQRVVTDLPARDRSLLFMSARPSGHVVRSCALSSVARAPRACDLPARCVLRSRPCGRYMARQSMVQARIDPARLMHGSAHA
jgi:hypothetical protein